MRLLLDTCSFIWLCSAPEQFSSNAINALRGDVELFLSDASVLEIALKHSSGKLSLPKDPKTWIEKQTGIWNIKNLPIMREVIFASADLPKYHKDPFDRLIIATSIIHAMPVVTPDRFLRAMVVILFGSIYGRDGARPSRIVSLRLFYQAGGTTSVSSV